MARKKVYMGDTSFMFLAALAALVIGAFGIYVYRVKYAPLVGMPKMMTVSLNAENGSGETGTAIFTENGGKVVVSLNLTGAPVGVTQPAHIHLGACPGVGAVKYPLIFPVDGKSETTLDVTLDQLKSMEPLALNVHKSATQASVYVSCGMLNF